MVFTGRDVLCTICIQEEVFGWTDFGEEAVAGKRLEYFGHLEAESGTLKSRHLEGEIHQSFWSHSGLKHTSINRIRQSTSNAPSTWKSHLRSNIVCKDVKTRKMHDKIHVQNFPNRRTGQPVKVK